MNEKRPIEKYPKVISFWPLIYRIKVHSSKQTVLIFHCIVCISVHNPMPCYSKHATMLLTWPPGMFNPCNRILLWEHRAAGYLPSSESGPYANKPYTAMHRPWSVGCGSVPIPTVPCHINIPTSTLNLLHAFFDFLIFIRLRAATRFSLYLYVSSIG